MRLASPQHFRRSFHRDTARKQAGTRLILADSTAHAPCFRMRRTAVKSGFQSHEPVSVAYSP